MCRPAGAVFVGSENFAEEANDCPNESAFVADVAASSRRCVGGVGSACIYSATVTPVVVIFVNVTESRDFFGVLVAAGTGECFYALIGAGCGGGDF